jgi:L-ascorbate metabolism protein UlaG (beta-lactamase superfamily)
VLGPLGHVGSGVAFLAAARRRRASDLETQAQLAQPAATPLPAALDLAWTGAAGVRLACQGTVVWIDPYLTRLSLGDFVHRRIIRADDDAIARTIDRADAILVGHTHFDHALDVPAIARRTGARVFGSESCARLMALHGLAEQAVTVEAHRDYEVGPFRFHFVPSVHSKLQLGYGVPSDGELTCEHLDHLTPQAYRCGQVWGIAIEVAGARLYHQGSADLLEDEIRARDRGVDVFLCGIAGRRFTPRFLERACSRLDPKLIVPTHYDDFFRPLAVPWRTSFNVNLTGFADEARAVRVPVRALPLHGAVAP